MWSPTTFVITRHVEPYLYSALSKCKSWLQFWHARCCTPIRLCDTSLPVSIHDEESPDRDRRHSVDSMRIQGVMWLGRKVKPRVCTCMSTYRAYGFCVFLFSDSREEIIVCRKIWRDHIDRISDDSLPMISWYYKSKEDDFDANAIIKAPNS
jgi:hypothetical protein